MRILASLLLCAAGQAERSEWELFRGLHEYGKLELHTEDPELALLLRKRVAPRQEALPLDTRVVGPGEASDPRAARVLFARLGGPGWERTRALTACADLSPEEFLAVDGPLPAARDAFLLTRADPERPGRPLTIVAGGADAPLWALYDLERPAWRGALCAWHEGELWLAAPRDPWTEGWDLTLTHHSWSARVHPSPDSSLRSWSSDAWLDLRAKPGIAEATAELERIRAYDVRLHDAGARARAWLGAHGAPTRPIPVRLLDRSDKGFLPQRVLAWPFDGEDGVFALCNAEQRDDGGAAFALACALADGGEPAQLWLRDAVGVAAARAWWGRPLEGWVGHLAASELALPVRELVDPTASSRHSIHRLAPLRASLLLALIAKGRDGLELWRSGLQLSEVDALEEGFAAWMRDLAGRHRASLGSTRDRTSPEPWRGFALSLQRDGWSGIERSPDVDHRPALAFARSRGADAISFTVLAPLDEPPAGVARPVATSASPSDVELTLACDAARALGLRTALVLEPLASPASVRADAVARTLPEAWEDFFDRYERVALHYALLAELLGCELYCFGVDLPWACDVESLAGHARKREIKRARWDALLERLRAAFDGRLTYAARTVPELEHLPFAQRLDLFAVLFFPRLELAGEPELPLLEEELRWHLELLADGAQRLGKPLLLLQTGFASCERAWESPEVPTPRPDAALQARLYQAFAGALAEHAWNEPWFAGLFLWELGLQPAEAENRGLRAWGKPAEAFLSAVLGR